MSDSKFIIIIDYVGSRSFRYSRSEKKALKIANREKARGAYSVTIYKVNECL